MGVVSLLPWCALLAAANAGVLPCKAGKYHRNSHLCKLCPLGKYQPRRGQMSCIECEVADLGRSGIVHGGRISCARCSPGHFQNKNKIWQQLCVSCPLGRSQTRTANRTSGVQCEGGAAGASVFRLLRVMLNNATRDS